MADARRSTPWRASDLERDDARLALLLCAPALLTIFAVVVFPLSYALWESFHLHDLRMPWRGRPFIGLANYTEAFADARFWGALAHTVVFTALSVSIELVLGLGLALLLHGSFAGRGLARTIALLPWALPAVVVALLFRLLFEPGGAADALLSATPLAPPPWLSAPRLSWLPIVIADAWKTTPFVALLLLAGLQGIDPALYEAARIDGAGPLAVLRHVTLPALRPALLVALLFRTVDALRVFDLIYVLTGGGPGTATEPLSMYAFVALLRHLRFGYGAALAMIVFATTLLLLFAYTRATSGVLLEEER